jgi:putative endonuclease
MLLAGSVIPECLSRERHSSDNLVGFVIPAKAGIQALNFMSKQPCVYILSSEHLNILYVGVTSNLIRRVWEHKNELVEGFTKWNKVHRLVWYEFHGSMLEAIQREKRLKKWNRAWKIRMIKKLNPNGNDLFENLTL